MTGMMSITTAVVCLMAVHAPLPSRAQDMAKMRACQGLLMQSLQPYEDNMGSPEVCPLVVKFAKCAMKASGRTITNENAGMYESLFENALATRPQLQGINCLFNFKVIAGIEDGDAYMVPGGVVQQPPAQPDQTGQAGMPDMPEPAKGGQNTGSAPEVPVKPMTPYNPPYKPVVVSDHCVETFKAAAYDNDINDLCPLADLLLRCQLSRRPGRKFALEEISNFENMIRMELSKAGTSCQINVRGVITEHNSQINAGNSVCASNWLVHGLLFGATVLFQLLA